MNGFLRRDWTGKFVVAFVFSFGLVYVGAAGKAQAQQVKRCFHAKVPTLNAYNYGKSKNTGTHGPKADAYYRRSGYKTKCVVGKRNAVYAWASYCSRRYNYFFKNFTARPESHPWSCSFVGAAGKAQAQPQAQQVKYCFHANVPSLNKYNYNKATNSGTHGGELDERYRRSGYKTKCRVGKRNALYAWATYCARNYSKYHSSARLESHPWSCGI